jgi:uncharacterized membrane protein
MNERNSAAEIQRFSALSDSIFAVAMTLQLHLLAGKFSIL